MFSTQNLNARLYPTVPAPATQIPSYNPQPTAPAMDNGPKKVVNLSQYIATQSSTIISHRDWEKGLWIANCFIIPLIVYPILSVVGHIVIEFCRDKYSEKYSEVNDYLRNMRSLLGPNSYSTIELDAGMEKRVVDIFSRYKNDSRYKKDPLMDFLGRNASEGKYVFKF